jgi:hypothetical protein
MCCKAIREENERHTPILIAMEWLYVATMEWL